MKQLFKTSEKTHLIKPLAMLVIAATPGVSSALTVNYDYYVRAVRYNSAFYGVDPTVKLNTTCDNGASQGPAFSCGDGSGIRLSSRFMQDEENSFGSYTAEAIISHEYAHEFQRHYGIRPQAPNLELMADCYAGKYIYVRKVYNGYQFNFNNIANAFYNLGGDYDHGSPGERWFAVSYGAYHYNSHVCYNEYNR